MNLTGKKVLVTGGCGFLGSHLVDKLVETGAKVTVVDLKTTEGDRNLGPILDEIEFVEIDITRKESFDAFSHDFDVIFHLAAYAAPSLCEKNPDIAFRVNVQGTFNVLKFAKKNKLSKMVFSSTAALYGTYPDRLPIDESHPLKVDESVYSITKFMGEEMCSLYSGMGVPIVVLRLFTTFGPKQSYDYFFPTLISQALGKKEIELWSDKPTRDFNFVGNTVDALMRAAESDFVGGPVNIGSGKETNVGVIAKKIADEMGVQLKFLDKEVIGPMRLCCDNKKAKDTIGWEPSVSLEDGLKITIEWYKNNSNAKI